jgi:hypothetical protein
MRSEIPHDADRLLDAALREFAEMRTCIPCNIFRGIPEEWEKCAEECAKDSPAPECWERYLKKKLEEEE